MASYNSHCFPVELAVQIGLREAILLQYFYHWHIGNRDNPEMQIEGRTWFYLSVNKIATAFPYFTNKQVHNILEHLEDAGMLIKGNHATNKMHRTSWYSLTARALAKFDLTERENAFSQMGKSSAQKGKCKSYNNNLYISSNEENKYTSIPPTPVKFDFLKALRGLGVEQDVAEAWMQVRKAKKAINTEIAFNSIVSEIEKSGKSANECIHFAVVKSWAGFRASWMENEERPLAAPAPAPRRKATSGFDHMIEVGRELGIIGGTFDEQ